MATKTPTLPSSDELELADYKLGSFGSDLDSLRSTLDKQDPEGWRCYQANIRRWHETALRTSEPGREGGDDA